MTQEIINILQMLVNENDPDMRTHYAVAINNYILELEKPKTCFSCVHSTIHDSLFRSCCCVCLVDEDGEPTNIVPNEHSCSLYHPKG